MGDKKDIENKEHWLKRAWKTKLAILAVLAGLWGVLEGVYFFTEKWHEYQELKTNEVQLIDRIDRLEKNQKDVLKYMQGKKQSFAVGFRVFKMEDEDGGGVTLTKRYRGWDGKWHEIFRDKEWSETYGVDYYRRAGGGGV